MIKPSTIARYRRIGREGDPGSKKTPIATGITADR
jgi:hypothetical protein